MLIDVNSCDLNSDYFHFSNRNNAQSIIDNGLQPSVGVASQLVGDEPNVSVSMGAKGVMGIISSFIYMFGNTSFKDIPEEYKKYFFETPNFIPGDLVGKDLACRAVARKLKEEVYFRIKLDEEQLSKATIGGLTGYDIKIPTAIDKSNIQLIAENGNVLSAYEFALSIYDKARDVDLFREIHEDFFYMFESKSGFYSDTESKRKS